jgi:hypothetical protein
MRQRFSQLKGFLSSTQNRKVLIMSGMMTYIYDNRNTISTVKDVGSGIFGEESSLSLINTD